MKLLLFSGGLDSSALAAWKRPDIALTIDYGQRAAKGEISAASAIAGHLGIRHEILRVDLVELGAGQMAGQRKPRLGKAPEWWPYRNQMLITLAGMKYVQRGLREIFIGAVSTDVHSDGKPRFFKAMNEVMKSQEGSVRISAPGLRLTGEELLRRSKFPADLLGLTFSCHVMEYACGVCRGCQKHLAIIKQIKIS